MGLRSWLTRIEEPGDWDFFMKALQINPHGFGVSYVIDIADDIPCLCKGIWVAWSGDGGWSLSLYMPGMFIERTVLLDELHEKFPSYDLKGPEAFGKLLDPVEIEKVLEERQGEDLLDGLFEPEEDELSPEECQGNDLLSYRKE